MRIQPTNPPPISFILVTRPSSGEIIYVGSVSTIVWLSSLEVTHVNIKLGETVIAANIVNSGSYGWTVTAPPANNYAIRVESATDSSVFDDSDIFRVQDPPLLTFTNPTTAMNLERGKYTQIT